MTKTAVSIANSPFSLQLSKPPIALTVAIVGKVPAPNDSISMPARMGSAVAAALMATEKTKLQGTSPLSDPPIKGASRPGVVALSKK